jgi:1-aminocyclopropane-1-carboxylate deaminase
MFSAKMLPVLTNMYFNYNNIVLQDISPSWLPDNIQAAMLRLDLLHPEVSGNKWFKLKYNLEEAIRSCETLGAVRKSENLGAARQHEVLGLGKLRILTFGGAYSNHIAATAAACKLFGLSSIGIIRGEKPAVLSHTLQRAITDGMQLEFVSREAYRNKDSTDWQMRFPGAYIIPEGGNNEAGAKGCREILSLADTSRFTHILCACGTGTTLAGLISSALPHQQVQGYVVLKGAEYLKGTIALLTKGTNWQLIHDYHNGGYAKTSPELIHFINNFYAETRIPLDVVYTGKLVWGFSQAVLNFPAGSKVLLIHTGGLQGNLSLSPDTLTF